MDKNSVKCVGKNDYIYILITFMYLFYFRFYSVFDINSMESTTILGGFLVFFCLISPQYRSSVYRKFCEVKTFKIIIFCFILLLISFLISAIHGKSDYSFVKLLFHQFVYLIVGVFCYMYFKCKGKENNIIEYIVYAFLIQSFIQYLAFLNPAFSSFTNMFKPEDIIILKQQYDGFRLNAISGAVALGLAVGYAIVITIFIFRWDELKLKHKILDFIILSAGGVASGRTAILLTIVSIGMFFLFKVFEKRDGVFIKKKTFFSLLILAVGILIIMNAAPSVIRLLPEDFQSRLSTVIVWLSRWKVTYFSLDQGSSVYNFWTASYSVIKQINSIFWGDGLYTNADGTYYLRTDAGYVRLIAYGGIFWVVFMFLYQQMFLKGNPYRRSENITIMALILVATLKADNLGVSIQNQLILIIMYLLNNDELYKRRRFADMGELNGG